MTPRRGAFLISLRSEPVRLLQQSVGPTPWLLFVFLFAPFAAHGQSAQTPQHEPSELETARARANSGKVDARDVVVIANARAVEAIPALERQFKSSDDPDTKLSIASGLVKLKDTDDTYWNFLLEQASVAVDSDLPDAFTDSQGKSRQVTGVPELTAWAQEHHVELSSARRSALFDLPGKVLQLGIAEDPRGIPLLRRALNSHNSMIVIMAAKSLAQIQDKDSIPSIIEACRRSPVLSTAIAEASLVFFNDPQAQAAIDSCVPPDRAKKWHEARMQGMRPLGE